MHVCKQVGNNANGAPSNCKQLVIYSKKQLNEKRMTKLFIKLFSHFFCTLFTKERSLFLVKISILKTNKVCFIGLKNENPCVNFDQAMIILQLEEYI